MSHQPTRATKSLKASRARLGKGSWAFRLMSLSIDANMGSRTMVMQGDHAAGHDQHDDRDRSSPTGPGGSGAGGPRNDCPSSARVSGTPPRASATRIMLRNIVPKIWGSRAIASSSVEPALMAWRIRPIAGPRARPGELLLEAREGAVVVDPGVEIRGELAAELRELARADAAEEDPFPPLGPRRDGLSVLAVELGRTCALCRFGPCPCPCGSSRRRTRPGRVRPERGSVGTAGLRNGRRLRAGPFRRTGRRTRPAQAGRDPDLRGLGSKSDPPQ